MSLVAVKSPSVTSLADPSATWCSGLGRDGILARCSYLWPSHLMHWTWMHLTTPKKFLQLKPELAVLQYRWPPEA
jgi:hypothetical protein